MIVINESTFQQYYYLCILHLLGTVIILSLQIAIVISIFLLTCVCLSMIYCSGKYLKKSSLNASKLIVDNSFNVFFIEGADKPVSVFILGDSILWSWCMILYCYCPNRKKHFSMFFIESKSGCKNYRKFRKLLLTLGDDAKS